MGKVVGLLVMVLAAVVGSNGPVTAKEPVLIIHCPKTVEYRVDWQDKFRSEALFTAEKGAESTQRAQIKSMERVGQKITCIYAIAREVRYDHQVERTIGRCLPPGDSTGGGKFINCEPKP